MNGVINVLKPPGMTSHDVVAFIRHQLETKKVGHAGTLDPQAAGVLPVCIGQATRLVDFLSYQDKEYMCRMVLGITTTTQDAWGDVVARTDASFVTREMVESALARFRGEIEQEVPAYSAVKVAGVPMYEIARRGGNVPVVNRRVTIKRIELLEYRGPELAFYIRCSKGTYIRTLCHDLGSVLKTGGHMSFLLRTRVGDFHLGESLTLEEIKSRKEKALLPASKCVAGLPHLVVNKDDLNCFRNGRSILFPCGYLKGINEAVVPGKGQGVIAVWGEEGNLHGLGEVIRQNDKCYLKPKRVFGVE
ncbi:MAG: tRNA pseudouridine(55) synthase TruB [Peptococcaceae bacterium]|jgi:tRNA pseudouridine55 synthase|nr:tRNA pseudouridine(55) synthase TruB [Peptococcaceae bacterium]MDH7524088.1 tRNA pseudouridine(55) synthase TruB [Peptococcaceae bacterium]